MSDDGSYEVQAIRKWRYTMRHNRKEYLIKWRGYPEDQNTWEPEEHLNCANVIKMFRRTLKSREKYYLDSKHPERLTGLQRNAEIVSMYGILEEGGPSTSASATNTNPRVVIFITFEDDDDTEQVDLEVLREFRPDKAFEFVEARLLDKASVK